MVLLRSLGAWGVDFCMVSCRLLLRSIPVYAVNKASNPRARPLYCLESISMGQVYLEYRRRLLHPSFAAGTGLTTSHGECREVYGTFIISLGSL